MMRTSTADRRHYCPPSPSFSLSVFLCFSNVWVRGKFSLPSPLPCISLLLWGFFVFYFSYLVCPVFVVRARARLFRSPPFPLPCLFSLSFLLIVRCSFSHPFTSPADPSTYPFPMSCPRPRSPCTPPSSLLSSNSSTTRTRRHFTTPLYTGSSNPAFPLHFHLFLDHLLVTSLFCDLLLSVLCCCPLSGIDT